MPDSAARRSTSAGVVAGVIRSTIEFGQGTSAAIHPASASSTSPATASRTRRATSPLCGRLSQDTTVNGGVPRSRRTASARTRCPKTGDGSSTPYPPSVMVSVTTRTAGSASRSRTASGSSGASSASTIEPTTCGSRRPSACATTTV
jgi:hypothetical protein